MIGSLVFATLLAGAPDARIVVAIGNDVGIGRDVPLDYAEADAKRFHQLMMEIGGVSEERSYLVVGGDARRVRSVLNEARGRIKELSAQSRTSLIVFVSSHADAEALHLGGTTLPLDELHGLVRGASADLKLTIVDACRTAATTYRGGQPVPEVDVAFGTPARVDGDVLITSASLGEPAQERAFLRGALFSHHLMTGLRGAADVDDDAVVSLTEAYTYAYRRTAADAPRGGATQRPSYAFDTRGFGSWVLTRPKTLDAGVRLSSELEGVFWVADNRRALVAEVVKARGEVVRLALAPGWYRVVRPDGRFAGVADVNLGWGGVRTLEADAFVRVPMSGSTLKGSAAIVARPLRLGLGYGAGLNPLPGDTFEHAPMLRIGYVLSDWVLRSSLTLATHAFRTQTSDVRNWNGALALGLGYETPVDILTWGAAFDLRAGWAYQAVQQDGEDEIARLFGTTEPDRQTWILGAQINGTLALPLSTRWWARLELGAGLEYVPLAEESGSLQPTLRGFALLTYAL